MPQSASGNGSSPIECASASPEDLGEPDCNVAIAGYTSWECNSWEIPMRVAMPAKIDDMAYLGGRTSVNWKMELRSLKWTES